MKIILNQDVQNLGEEGDVREVARGYARNYLIPKGLGVAYTKQNLALLEGKRNAIEKRKDEKRDHAAGMKERIESLDLQIAMTVGETGRLFGSVTNTMLAEELAKLGIEVERKRIEIPDHTIKMTGKYSVAVKLYGTEVASLKVTVTGPKGSEATGAAETAAAAAVAPEAEVESSGIAEGEEAAEAPEAPAEPESIEEPQEKLPEAAAPAAPAEAESTEEPQEKLPETAAPEAPAEAESTEEPQEKLPEAAAPDAPAEAESTEEPQAGLTEPAEAAGEPAEEQESSDDGDAEASRTEDDEEPTERD